MAELALRTPLRKRVEAVTEPQSGLLGILEWP